MHGYRRNSTEWMLRMVLKEKVLVGGREFSGVQEEKKRGETKQLESWRWLKNGFLKKETEGSILAAQ